MSVSENSPKMAPELISRLNELWLPVYPHLAQWIKPWIPENTGHVLEIGPFSGGIIASLSKHHSTVRGLIALAEEDVARSIRKSFGPFCPMLISPLAHLPLLPAFNLVVSRGAFFFLNPEIIKESQRILKPGGCALLGGGYGPDTPEHVISPIAEESKDLNYRLGKKRLSRSDLEKMASEAGLETQSTIINEGGLWLLISSKD